MLMLSPPMAFAKNSKGGTDTVIFGILVASAPFDVPLLEHEIKKNVKNTVANVATRVVARMATEKKDDVSVNAVVTRL
jgi:hypothetical protein